MATCKLELEPLRPCLCAIGLVTATNTLTYGWSIIMNDIRCIPNYCDAQFIKQNTDLPKGTEASSESQK